MRRLITATMALGLLAPGAMAQQPPPDPSAEFVREWSQLDGSINAASLQRAHVVEKAQALVGDWQKRGAELGYWHKWIEGERAGWAPK